MPKLSPAILFKNMKSLIERSRNDIVQTINTKMVDTYCEIGKLIVEHEQEGSKRAKYAASTLKDLSLKLTKEFGKGFSVDNLENLRRFYVVYGKSETASRKLGKGKNISQKSETVSRKSGFQLSWSHYIFLLRITNKDERNFYEIEARNGNWSLRELKRQYNSALYERLVLSRNKKKIKELSKKGQVIESASDVIKDPYILEFLSLKEHESYTESELEAALITRLEEFLKELGKGFLFVSRQYRITLEEEHYRIDLVFYNRILRCFILINLKIGELVHKDIGQMQMYVNYFDEEIRETGENKTIGIILCKNKKESIVRYMLPKGNDQIFASKYKTYLPDKTELKLLMEPEVVYSVKSKNE
jgi:predicted nuclease of restriction endonuclease-like (RecB) superfamily